MAENQVTLDELVEQLQSQANHLGARNLVLVALPLATAHARARELALKLQATYIDFDCELLDALIADGWDFHLKQEQRGRYNLSQAVANQWLTTIAQRLQRNRPLVIGNINLAVRYAIDVTAALYDASARGLCVIAAGGRIQDQTLWVHGVHCQTSANAPTYTVVAPVQIESASKPRIIQDRLI